METGTDIIIIGAGPAGLVAALTLVQEGQKVAIYDALPKGQNGSRAAGVHAHTLEVRNWEFFPNSSFTDQRRCSNSTHWDMQTHSFQWESRHKA